MKITVRSDIKVTYYAFALFYMIDLFVESYKIFYMNKTLDRSSLNI